MADVMDALVGAGAAGVIVFVLVFALLPLFFVIGVWRIGTALQAVAFELKGPEGTNSVAESAHLQAEAVAALVNREVVKREKKA